MLRELGVEVHTGVEVDADAIHEAAPDVVIVATGADPLVPPIPGIAGPNVIDAQEILHDRVTVAPGERYAVIGGSATGCETAEWLIAAGAEVTIVEMLPIVGQGIELITRRHLLADLRGKGVSILTKAKVTMVEPNAVLYEHTEDGSTGTLDVENVATAVGWSPRGSSLAGSPRRARGSRPRRCRASGRLRQRDQRRSGRGPAGLTFAFFDQPSEEREGSRVNTEGARIVEKVGVVGLGTMGSGIAQLCVQAGVPTVACESSSELATGAGADRAPVRARRREGEADRGGQGAHARAARAGGGCRGARRLRSRDRGGVRGSRRQAGPLRADRGGDRPRRRFRDEHLGALGDRDRRLPRAARSASPACTSSTPRRCSRSSR